MPELNDDATQQADESQSGEGTQDGSPDQTGTDAAAQIASYRKRQAGAEAARQAAEKKAADLQAKLEAYEATNRSASDKELADVAKLQERLAAAEQKAAEAEAKANARVLDAKYPNARKELPEVTDEVRLSKFEAMLADTDPEPPTPTAHNESKSTAGGAVKEQTADELKAALISAPDPGWFNQNG